MRVRDAMTPAPVTCEPTTLIRIAAQLMADHDCASIPVTQSGTLVGIVTDRDIACRAVAQRLNTADGQVASVMTAPVIAADVDDPLEYAASMMESNGIHHIPVIRADGTLVGIVAQSDVAQRMTNREFGRMARSTSVRTHGRSISSAALVRKEA